jgi:hypothetical protein
MSVLSFSKTVLMKVSFDEKLFEKELRKAMERLMLEEMAELRQWCYSHFPHLSSVLNRCFSSQGMASA